MRIVPFSLVIKNDNELFLMHHFPSGALNECGHIFKITDQAYSLQGYHTDNLVLSPDYGIDPEVDLVWDSDSDYGPTFVEEL